MLGGQRKENNSSTGPFSPSSNGLGNSTTSPLPGTKWWLFALCTGIPQITGILAVIPKFLYPLSGSLRDRMYSDLMQRRHEMNEIMTQKNNEIIISVNESV